MAEAPNILLCMLILLLPNALTFQETIVLVELLLLGLGACWTLGGLHNEYHPPCAPTKSTLLTSSTAPPQAQAPISIPLVQGTNEEKEEEEI
jgi:hypothetical protein